MTENTATVTVNGKNHPCPPGLTVSGLLATLGIGEESVVVEVNGDIVARPEFASRPIMAGDVIEIVQFVGGG